jgi:hypothetical protein
MEENSTFSSQFHIFNEINVTSQAVSILCFCVSSEEKILLISLWLILRHLKLLDIIQINH